MREEKIKQLLRRGRPYLGYLIILLTIVGFSWYLTKNPSALEPIKSTPLFIIPLLLVLYGLFLITNFLITAFTIAINKRSYPLRESFILTMYSTLVNFFGPLQSGPGFRAIYLKKKVGLKIKDYTLATMLYYGAFAGLSLAMLFGPAYPVYTTVAVLTFVAAGLYFFRNQRLSVLIRNFTIIGVITVAQITIVAVIYYIELLATGYHPSLASTLAYTGSANLALFVAFTPGAIGIRESFIYLSQNIHSIPTEQIVNASLLDRSVYLIFLGILFVVSSFLHVRSKLQVRKPV